MPSNPPAPSSHNQNPVKVGLVMLFVATAIAVVQYKIPTIMLPIMDSFGIDANTASWLMSVFLLVGVFVALPIGGLTARFGFRRMILAAFGLALLGAALGIVASLSSSGALLIGSRAIEGIAFTVITACGPIAVNQCVRPERIGTAMGLFGNWGTCGSTISSFIVPGLFYTMGFAWVWVVVSLISIIAAVLLLALIKEPRPSTVNALDDEPAARPQPGSSILRQYREIFNRDTILYLLGFVIFNMILLALLSYLPSILQVKGFEATLSGLVTSAPLLLSMVAVPVFGIVSDRLGKVKPLLMGTMALFGPGVFLMYTSTDALLWVGVALVGLFSLGSIGLFLTGWSQVLPRRELVPVGMGVMIFFQCIGQFLGTFTMPMLLGPGFDNTLLAGIILVVLGLAGSTALLASRFR
jgi:MFS family permease